MANMFGGSPQNGYGSSYNMQPSGIPVYNMATKEGAEQYPIPAGTTAMFMNYNARKLWMKTMHQNGLSYDFEDLTFFTNAELQQYTQQIQKQTLDSQTGSQSPVKTEEFVSRREFDELKKQFEEFIK